MMRNGETKVLDLNSEFLGIPPDTLMENAGEGLASIIDERFGDDGGAKMKNGGKRMAIVCGTGNNGGDGFVAARHLVDMGWKVKVLLVKTRDDVRSRLSKNKLDGLSGVRNLEIVESADVSEIGGCPVILDCVLGTGISGEVREPYRAWIEAVNLAAGDSWVVSCDVPSGLGTNISIKPHITVTFHDSKEGMTPENSGDIIIHDIGVPDDASKFVGPGEFADYPLPGPGSHKGMNGRVLVVGGGPYTGAPALAAMAAYAGGADLVTLAVPENCFCPIAGYSPMLIVRPLPGDILIPEHLAAVEEMAKHADVLIVGPGAGRSSRTLEFLRSLISRCEKSMVIDADALTALSGHLDSIRGKRAVLTPHRGEFGRLTDSPPIRDFVRMLAAELGVVIVLKGAEDIVSDGQCIKLNRTGNPAMTVGGTGDVLAGLIGGILARGAEPYEAARMGAYLCGTAGDLAFDDVGHSMTAPDVILAVPEALKEVLAFVESGD